MRKKFLLMLTVLVIALGGSGKLFAQQLLVNCDYNSSTEGYGTSKFSNYTGAYAYATANGKTSATIVIEKTNTISGNCFDNNHKNYSKLAVVIKDGATMGNSLSKWDMTYPVTVEPGGTLTCARGKDNSISNIHIKNKLIVGAKDATKKAYVNFLSDEYQDCDISIRYNGSIEVYNADFYVQDLDAQGKLTIEDSDVTVDGAFASATSSFYPTTLTNSTIAINGTQIEGGLSDFAGGTYNQLGNVKINNSTLTIKEGDTKVATQKYLAGTMEAKGSTIEVNNLTIADGATLNLNEGSTLDVDGDITGDGNIKIDGNTAPIINGDMYVPVSNFNAFKTAVEAGNNVQLTADITTTSAIVTSGVTSVIDLNGKTLTIGAGDNKFNDESNVTIKKGNVNININGVTVKGNAIFCLDEYEKTLVSTLTFDEVNLTGEDYSSAYGVFYIGESSVLNVNGGEWNLNNDTHASGGVFKADGSGAKLNIVGLNLTAHNVRRVVTYANTTIKNSTMTISGDAEGVDSEMEHGFNRSPLAISNSTITMKDMVGRGITAQNGAVTISENSNVNITNCIEATIDVRNNQTVTIDNTSTVFVDKEPTLANGCTINGTVKLPTVAKIGAEEYSYLADALEAAKSMTGDVTVEICAKVTMNQPLAGSYTSIKFVGPQTRNNTDAEIYLDVQGYITATGKKVAFENLKLSKSEGGFIANAGFMNVAFGIFDVAEVSYTNCTFLNGACASFGKVTYTGCTFNKSWDKYGLWAYGNVDVTVNGCTFADYRGIKMYAENGANASVEKPNLIVENTNFLAVDNKPAIVLTYGESVTLENNTYSSTGVFELDLDGAPNGVAVTSDVAPTCINDNGACGVLVDGKIYTTVAQAAEVSTSGSTVTLLHNSTETVELPMGVNLVMNGFTADNVTITQPFADYVELPSTMNENNYKAMFGTNTVTDGTNYYATLQAATEAVAGTANAVLYCKPNANVGSLQHAPVTSTLTVYGNNANVIDGGERDFDLGNTDPNGGRDITADMTLTVKHLNGCGAWGAKATAHTVNLVFENCDNMGKVFISGTTGTLNITMTDCAFKGVLPEAIYSNADGAITLNNVAFSNLNKAVNLNHKAAGTQTVTINGCSFTNCGNDVTKDEIPVRVLTSVAGGKTVLAVSNTTFSGTKAGGADILLPNDKGVTDATIQTTAANIKEGTAEMKNITEDVVYKYNNAVAKIGETPYASLQAAVNVVKNGETVVLVSDCAEVVSFTQTADKSFVIDGNNKIYTGSINITARAGKDAPSTLVIKNFNFNTDAITHDFIKSVETNYYPNNITISGCKFNGTTDINTTDYAVVAVRLKSANNIKIENCTGSGLHSFLQNTAGWNIQIDNVDVTNSLSGFAMGTVQGANIKNCDLVVNKSGIRFDAQLNNNAVITDNEIKAFIPVVVRKASVESKMTFNGENTFTATNTDGLWCAIGTSEYETNGTMPTPATGRVSVTLNDAGLDVEGIYGYTISGEGTAEKPYLINNINDLIVFRNNVNAGNNYSGKYVKLNADIDLNNEAWEPIGYMGKNFIGNFDGGNHTISNLKVVKELTNAAANNGVGLFGRVDSPATIKNLTIENATVKGSLYVGAVVGYAYTGNAIENVTVKGNIAIDAYWYAGVIGGNGYMNLVNNCHVIGNDGSYIKGNNGSYIGGIWGFRGEGANNITNCTVTNLSIEGVDRVGGISGMAHYGNTISGCAVKDVTVAATDAEATTVGLIAGACQGTVSEPSTITYSEVDDVTVTIGGNNVDASIYGTKIDGTTPYTNYVARIGGMQYITLADAVAAAKDGETIEFLPLATNKVVAMNASLYGKSVTITGTAKVDWSKGFLFVGRGGEGDATLTFDNANLTSASNSASYGIHVSGREKNTTNKYDGTVVIKNSTIDLDYLINKGAMTLDKATLTVKNGFAIGGRPAKETESGVDETATIALTNGSKVVVNNHNGMGLGYEAIGVMNISSGSTFECTQDFLVTAKGTMNVNGGVVTTDVKITNNGVINVSGESTLNIASFEGEDINFLDGAIINNSTIGGDVFVAGNVTFRGDNTFNMLYDYGTLTDYYGTTAPMKWNVKEGASLTLTDKARYGLGYGDNVTIIGSIDNALTARKNLTEIKRSLFMHGLVAQESKGWNCSSALNIENAYVVIGSNNSFGNKPGNNYGGTYTFNIKNSVVDASRITFYEALSATTFTFDGSDVKMGTFMTNDADSKFTLKDSKVLSTTTTNGTDEGNYNAGELTLVNSSLTYSATLSNTGVITVDAKSTLTAPAISGDGKITIDAANFVIGSGDVQVVYATINVDENNINVVNNNYVTAVITETGIVIKENNLEGEGKETNPYIVSSLTELELFRNKVNAGDNYAGKYVKLSADVNLSATRSANNWEPIGTTANPFKGIFDGDNKVISNLVVEGENYVGLFGYADNATIKNVTINNANVKGVECVGVIAGNVYSTSLIDNCHVKGNIKVEGQTSVGGIVGKYYTKVSNCSVIGDGVATSYVKGTYVKSDFEGDNIGGIMGHGGENNRFTGNTVKNITISGTRKVGGVVGVTDKATQVVNCVVENVNIETTATAEYAASNKAKSGHGAIVGSYTTGGTAGLVADCVVKNVNFINEDNVTVSAGPITGGARGGSDSMLAPEGVTSSNNDIYMSTITGSNNLYLMNAVAKIGEVEYYTLQDAFNAGGEVVVLRDIVLTEGVTVKAGKEVVLDLNGFAVSYTSSVAGEDMITNRGDLTIVDGSTAKTGKITYNNTDATGANVTVSTISTEPGSTLVVNGGTIENKTDKADGSSIYSYAIDLLTNGNLGDVNVTINGGTVYSDYMAIRQFNNGTACKNILTIKGGYIYGAKRAVQVHIDNNAAYTTIVNGTVEAGANGYSLCFFPTTSENISVSGGEFIGNVYSGSNGFITGGTFTTDVNEYCAADFSAIPQGPTWVVKQVKGTQTRELASAGWYWFSSYIDIEGEEGLEDLQEALNGNGKEVRGQDGFTRYFKSYNSWTPGLNTVSTEEMYMINTTAPVTVSLDGNFVSEDRRITLNPGWNWIGYPVRVSVPVEDALAGFEPQEGDVIKSKSGGFSEYSEGAGGWFPSFDLVPGEGYKYYSEKTTSTSFVYSTTITNASASKGNVAAEYHWTPAAGEYAENMVVIAMLDINGEYANENYEVAAFANGECRGSARPIYNEKLDKHMLFMTVCGDEVEDLSFRCYDVNSGREYDLINRVVYSNDAVVGSMNEPYIFTCSTLGIGEATLSDINIYPNPTTTDREINLQATCDKVEVFNTLGVKVAEYQNVDSIDALETAGTYVIRVTLNGDVKHCRLVVR